LQGAFVIARESAFSFKGKELDVREVGRQLGVRYVLEGSVRKLGDTVRINAQLVSATTGAHLWAERFDEPVRELATGQDVIVGRIGAALGAELVKPSADITPAAAASQPAAYDLVLRARSVLNEPPTDERNTIAAGLFEQALRADPHSVPAMAGVASTLAIASKLAQFYVRTHVLRRASELIAAAEHIAPGSPDVLAAKYVLQRRTGRVEDSVATLRTLLDADSSAAGLAAKLGPCREDCWGAPDTAIPLIERILRLNPTSPANSLLTEELGRALLEAGQSEHAVGVLEGVLGGGTQPGPGFQSYFADRQRNHALLYLASAYAWLDRLEDAKRTLGIALRSPLLMDLTVRSLLADIPRFDDPARIAQRRRFVDGLRRAGLRNQLDEDADSGVPSDAMLRAFEWGDSPTPMTVPGGTTVRTAELERLLAERKPLVLTTASTNPSIPGAILIDQFNSGSLDDVWQARLQRMMQELTGGDLHKPVVTFAYDINRWYSRNLALRLIALGYTDVYWYRGGWETWDAHGLPEVPVALMMR
jgi:adenylate cyclase